jgi:putative transcriptional regulator
LRFPSTKALAAKLNVHPTSISRLKTQDVLPEIGRETLAELINAINKLNISDYGACTLAELIEIIAENDNT